MESKVTIEHKNYANKEIESYKYIVDELKNQKGNLEAKIKLLETEKNEMKNEYDCNIEKKMSEKMEQIDLKNAEIVKLNQKLTDINALNSLLENKVTELTNQLKTMDELIQKSNLTNVEHQKNIQA